MNADLLQNHIREYVEKIRKDPDLESAAKREERRAYYQAWTQERIARMDAEDLYEFIAKLWSMLIWGNKHYVVDKMINDNGLETIRTELAVLLYGDAALAERWDRFRKSIKGIGQAMISEVLAHVHPDTCMIWNRRAYVALNYLGVPDLPRHSHQVTGQRYEALCDVAKIVAKEMGRAGIERSGCEAA